MLNDRYMRIFLVIIGMLTLFACMDDDVLWQTFPEELPDSLEGVFIVNEGNFMYGNASLSYYDPAVKSVYHDVFFNTNALPLGDVAHSMTIRNSLGYLVINNSGRIYVVDIETFELRGKMTGFTSPRFIHFVHDEKAYVSDLYARSIAIVNPKTFEITGSIDVENSAPGFYQHATEQMIQVGHEVFINCWSYDRHILVVDTETDQWVETIEVPLQPQSMVLDKHEQLWVLCDGGFPGSPYGQEEPALIRINPASREMDEIIRFGLDDHPLSLAINNTRDTLYFINRHVYRHAVMSGALPELFIESPYQDIYQGGFKALGVDPTSSEVYVGDAIDYVQPGMVVRYSPHAAQIDAFRVGIIPRSFVFRVVGP